MLVWLGGSGAGGSGCDIEDLPNQAPPTPIVDDVIAISPVSGGASLLDSSVFLGAEIQLAETGGLDFGPAEPSTGAPPRGVETLCHPCEEAGDCAFFASCVEYDDGGTFCGAACTPFNLVDACPVGYSCEPMYVPESARFLHQCRTILDTCEF